MERWTSIVDEDVQKKTFSIINKLYNTNPNRYMPAYKDILKVFKITPYNYIKVVMLFMDPYSTPNTATGIPLANKKDTKILSPSLKVLKESVINFEIPHNCCTFDPTLEEWSKQGILLLNSALTVEVGKPGSHLYIWRDFIKSFLYNFSMYNPGVIYVLWGNTAKSFKNYINSPAEILTAPHPAFFARNNSKIPYCIFTKINELCVKHFNEPINWYNELNLETNENY